MFLFNDLKNYITSMYTHTHVLDIILDDSIISHFTGRDMNRTDDFIKLITEMYDLKLSFHIIDKFVNKTIAVRYDDSNKLFIEIFEYDDNDMILNSVELENLKECKLLMSV